MSKYVDIVLQTVPDSPDMLFVEIEDDQGHSIKMGKGVHRHDGYFVIRVTKEDTDEALG